jgi:hypothetical protein
MKRLIGLLIGTVGLVLAIFSGTAIAATECNTPGPPLSGKIAGGVVVNAGDVCFLVGASVSGGVQVNSNGVLFLCASTVSGGLVSDGAAAVIVGAEEIGCDGNVINGGVRVSNTGPSEAGGPPSLALENSAINGAVHLTGNQGAIAVAANTIKGGLFCSNNASNLDDEGMPNTVTGPVRCKFGD